MFDNVAHVCLTAVVACVESRAKMNVVVAGVLYKALRLYKALISRK